MAKEFKKLSTCISVAVVGAIIGVCATVAAADLKISGGAGESAEMRALAKTLGITKYEDDNKVGGGGAEQKVLVENDVVRVNLVSFKKGFTRPGGLLRKNDQMIVYVDPAHLQVTKAPGAPDLKTPIQLHYAPGSSVFHYKDTVISELHIDEDYRALFIEFKKR